MEAADIAISAMGQAKTNFPKKRKIKDEVNQLFNHKKRKEKCSVWKHRFFGVARKDQIGIPTTDTEKDDLLKSGLGERDVEFHDLDMDAYSYRETMRWIFCSLTVV